MIILEKLSQAIRHAPGLRRRSFLWSAIRPAYDRLLRLLWGNRGLPRVINGTLSYLRTGRFDGAPEGAREVVALG